MGNPSEAVYRYWVSWFARSHFETLDLRLAGLRSQNWLHSGWCMEMLCTRSDHVACLECVFLRVLAFSCACLIGRAHLQPVG